MKKVLFLALAAGMFTFVSCDSKQANQAEKEAKQIEKSADVRADEMEKAGEEGAADTVRQAGDKYEDSIDAAH